jgi:hypothetical protein
MTGATEVPARVAGGQRSRACWLGLISEALHARVDQARQQVLALIESREAPFTEGWSIQRHDPGWPAPVLPPDALTVPAAF